MQRDLEAFKDVTEESPIERLMQLREAVAWPFELLPLTEPECAQWWWEFRERFDGVPAALHDQEWHELSAEQRACLRDERRAFLLSLRGWISIEEMRFGNPRHRGVAAEREALSRLAVWRGLANSCRRPALLLARRRRAGLSLRGATWPDGPSFRRAPCWQGLR